MVQEILSAAKTPTLVIAIPLYEQLLLALRTYKQLAPNLAHGINAMIAKIEEYTLLSRGSQAYTLAMC